MAGGSSTSTSVFNMVLNTVGAGGFANTLTTAQNAINGVVVSLNKAGQAAASGRVNSELQAAAFDKQTAAVNRAQVSLDVFRIKIQQNAQNLGALTIEQSRLNNEIATLEPVLQHQLATYAKMEASGTSNAGALKAWENQITQTTQQLSSYRSRLEQVNKEVDAGTSKEKLYQAQLTAREARLKAQTTTLEEIKKPLSTFESVVATLIQVYDTVDKVSRTFDRLTLTLQRVERIWINLKNIMSGNFSGQPSGNGLGMVSPEALASQSALTASITTATGGLGFFASAAATALGTTLSNLLSAAAQGFQNLIGMIQQAGQSLVGLGQQGFNAAGELEAFNTSMKAMIAVQKVEVNGSLDMADAMKQSAVQAANLTSWAVKVGVFSPYLVQNAKDALQMSIAMGYDIDTAKKLTQAVFDWGAGTGKTGEQVDSVVRMLGQMNSLGTFNGRILRELGFGGISLGNIYAEMAKQTGKSVEELKKMEKQGQITAEVGVNAIIGFMNKFQGSAATMAGSVKGLTTSLASMGQQMLQEFVGPLDVADQKITGIAGAIQGQLKKVVDFISQDWVPVVVTDFGNVFGDLANQAFTWGDNIVQQFAAGMLAALNSVLDSLGQIADAISYWLSPGSPPKILPDIGNWGKSAINEFFKGFTQGDFSLFDTMSGEIEKHIRSVLIREPSDKEGVLNNILGERGAMAEAVAQMDSVGSVTEAALQKIFKSMGGATSETQNYIRTSFQLEAQNRKVSAAQDALNAATDKYNKLLKPVEDSLQAITDAQANLTAEQQKTMLQLILKDPNATQAEKAQARLQIEKLGGEEKQRMLVAEQKKEVDAAQAKVDAETAKQKALQATLALQQSILNDENAQVALMQEYYDLMKQIANEGSKAGGGGGGAPPTPDETKPKGGGAGGGKGKPIQLPKWLTDLQEKIQEIANKIDHAFDGVNKALQPVWDAFGRLQKAVGDASADFKTYIPEINNKIGEAAAWTAKYMGEHMPHAIDQVSEAVKHLQGIWDKNHKLILDIAFVVWKIVIILLLGVIDTLATLANKIAEFADRDWAKTFKDMLKTATDFMKFLNLLFGIGLLFLGGIIDIQLGIIQGFFLGNFDQMRRGVASITLAMLNVLLVLYKMFLGYIGETLSKWVGDILQRWNYFLDLIYVKWKSATGEISMDWHQFLFDVKFKLEDVIPKLIAAVTGWFTSTKTEVKTSTETLYQMWKDFWTGDADSILSHLNAVIKTLLTNIGKWLTDTGTALNKEIPVLKQLAIDMMQGLINGAASMAEQMIDAFLGPINDAIARAKKLLGIGSPSKLTRDLIGKPMGEGIAEGLKNSGGMIQSAMSKVLGDSLSVNMIGGGGAGGGNSAYNSSSTTNFNYSPTYQGGAPAASDNFALMRAMVI